MHASHQLLPWARILPDGSSSPISMSLLLCVQVSASASVSCFQAARAARAAAEGPLLHTSLQNTAQQQHGRCGRAWGLLDTWSTTPMPCNAKLLSCDFRHPGWASALWAMWQHIPTVL
jgi:hypothetical protein